MDNTTPSSTTPANPPTGTTSGTGLCCTCEVEGRVATNGEGTYFNSSFITYGEVWNDCHLKYIRSGNGGRVEVTVRYCLGFQNGANWTEHNAQMKALIASAQVAWNRAARGVRLQIKQDGCPEQRLTVQFKFVSASDPYDTDVSIYADNTLLPANPTKYDNRSFVQGGSVMVFYLNETGGDLEWTMFHEFGHVLGQPDEYAEEIPVTVSPSGQGVTATPVGPAPTVSYHRTASQKTESGGPSPTVVTLPPSHPDDQPGEYVFATNSAMGTHGALGVYGENFFWVAIETEAMFAAHGTSASAAIISSGTSYDPEPPSARIP